MLNPNSPYKRFKFVAKTYGERSPGVVMDTFFLLSDLAGIEQPQQIAKATVIWYRIAFKLPSLAVGLEPMMLRRQLLWSIDPNDPIDEAMYQHEDEPKWPFDPWTSVRATLYKSAQEALEHTSQVDLVQDLLNVIGDRRPEGMFQRYESDPIWPWVAQQLNRAKKRSRRASDPSIYVDLLNQLRGKGSALALWQEQERIDLNKTTAEEALLALETFEPDIDVEQGEIVYEWDDGWTVQKLTQADQLIEEGEIMQHCVGSYCEEVESEETTIYSLRDPEGKPHATMEVKAGETRFEQVQGKQNQPPIPEYQERIDEFGKAEGIGPAGLTADERAAAEIEGRRRAEVDWDGYHESIMDRDGGYPHDIQEATVEAVFVGHHVSPESDLWDEAAEAVSQAAEDRWEEMFGEAMQSLDDYVPDIVDEAQDHLADYGDLSDFDFEEVARAYLWDIPAAGPSDAMYMANEAASNFDPELFEPRDEDDD